MLKLKKKVSERKNMQSLQTLINMLRAGRNIHISVLDLSGILNTPETALDFSSTIHSKGFCWAAKSTERGKRICFRCKALANNRAAESGAAFSGYCSFGLYEYALPVKIGESVAAVVYVGNAIIDKETAEKRLMKTCRLANLSPSIMLTELEKAESLESADELCKIAEIVADYLKILTESSPKAKSETHWLLAAMKRYADETYTESITLSELGTIYRKNEKYLGRLFKREMGVSYNEYVLTKKIQKAEKLLIETNEKIIEIALSCGFDNIPYFNRVFLKKNRMSPTKFRNEAKKQK